MSFFSAVIASSAAQYAQENATAEPPDIRAAYGLDSLLDSGFTGLGETITVRKVSFGQGVERIFPIHAKVVDHIDVVRTGRVRRAKLYYLRGLKGKAARLRERT